MHAVLRRCAHSTPVVKAHCGISVLIIAALACPDEGLTLLPAPAGNHTRCKDNTCRETCEVHPGSLLLVTSATPSHQFAAQH